MRILNVITGLNTGGAETMLLKLCGGLRAKGADVGVVSLLEPGTVGRRIAETGVPVEGLGMRRGVPSPGALFSLVSKLRRNRPDVVLSWLYHADLLAFAATRFVPRTALVWNLRCSYMNLAEYRRTTGLTVRTCAALSRFPDAVMANSEEAIRFHETLGYRPRRTQVIPNGFDLELFRPDAEARRAFREKLGVAEDDLLVGLAGRFDPMKDHATFLAGAGIALKGNPRLRFALCGTGVDEGNAELMGLVRATGAAERMHLLGRQDDMPGFMAGLDLLTLSSIGESFPNVLGEAMACGVPCVSTDVGDAASILGDTGTIVPPADPEALARAMVELSLMSPDSRAELGDSARARVERNYGLESVTRKYISFLEQLRK